MTETALTAAACLGPGARLLLHGPAPVAALRLRTATIRFFIGTLQFSRARCLALMEADMDLCCPDDNIGYWHWIYALSDEVSEGIGTACLGLIGIGMISTHHEDYRMLLIFKYNVNDFILNVD